MGEGSGSLGQPCGEGVRQRERPQGCTSSLFLLGLKGPVNAETINQALAKWPALYTFQHTAFHSLINPPHNLKSWAGPQHSLHVTVST